MLNIYSLSEHNFLVFLLNGLTLLKFMISKKAIKIDESIWRYLCSKRQSMVKI